jgi:hypothetical protein
MRKSSLGTLLGTLMMPLLALATPGQDCIKHPTNPNCAVTSVAMPEHWGSIESIGFCALVLIVFFVMIRLKVLRLPA